MEKAIVGVMPLWDDSKKSVWMLPGYFDGITKAGGIPIMLPITSDEAELEQLSLLCDGFLFTGGHDVSPRLYKEEPLECVFSCKERDEMESIILRKACDKNKPILGICRGIQFINVAFGGSLYQDIPAQYSSKTNHHQSAPYDVPIHSVNIVKDSPLYDCLRKEKLEVNSYHHQAVKDIAPKLKAMAISEDGLIEALYSPDYRFLWAVQWHPEFSFQSDNNSMNIFNAFIDAMKYNNL